jgi:hypothetical protein
MELLRQTGNGDVAAIGFWNAANARPARMSG